ncbi:uncharacterized protein KIAA1671 homolog [Ascaphus truei]|uniref:uncharacterized protein KIAA1671 homolog n=1 Tax=Ascaphus truei TaxID=8439 RepID=UPI003F591C65
MTTKVEMTTPLTSRTTQANLNEILHEVKSSRPHISPLSDASNKSSESSLTGSLILEEPSRSSTKSVSMFTPGSRPRLSPKPFSKEKPPDFWESRKPIGTVPRLPIISSVDIRPLNDMSSLGSLKKDEGESARLRISRSSQQPNTEVDRSTRAEVETFSATSGIRRLRSFSQVPRSNAVEESKPASVSEEWESNTKPEVACKPVVTYRKPEVSQPRESVCATATRLPSSPSDAAGEHKEFGQSEKSNNPSTKAEGEDNSPVSSVQLRPKRRPVSAIFLESINDQTQDNPVVEEEKTLPGLVDGTWIRKPRPLSMDLTAKFESRGSFINRKGNTSEETKENIPLKKNAFNTNTIEEKPELGSKEKDGASLSGLGFKTLGSDMKIIEVKSGVPFGNLDSPSPDNDSPVSIAKGKRYTREQEITDVGENQGIIKLTENTVSKPMKLVAQEETSLPDISLNSTNEESGITRGTIRRRISLLLANTGSSMEGTDSPTAEEEDGNSNLPQRIKGFTPEITEIKPGSPRTSLPFRPLSADLTKIFSSSPPNMEPKYARAKEGQSVYVAQEYGNGKDNVDQKSNELSEEKPWKTRGSFRKLDQPRQIEDRANVSKDRKSYTFKDQLFDTTTEAKEKDAEPVETPFKTVKATMFEHNVERHRVAEICPTRDTGPKPQTKSETFSDRFVAKNEVDSLEDFVRSKQTHIKSYDVSDVKKSEGQVGKAALSREKRNPPTNALETRSSTDRPAHSTVKKVEDNVNHQRIEPRYEIIQAVGERALSESIKMVPEDKAVTLRSRRSFHRKEREQDKPQADAGFSDHSLTKLQRSKSEHRKREIPDRTKETAMDKYSSRDLDILPVKKYSFRQDISQPIKAPTNNTSKTARSYPTDINKTKVENKTISDFQEKTPITDKKKRTENLYVSDFPERDYFKDAEGSPFAISTADHLNVREDLKRSDQVSNFKSLTCQTGEAPTENDSEMGRKRVAKEESPVDRLNIGEGLKRSAQVENHPGPVRTNVIKDEPTDIIKLMLNKDIEQIKKDLTVVSPAKNLYCFETEKTIKDAFLDEKEWVRGKSSFQDGDTGSEVDTLNKASLRTSDLLILSEDGAKMKTNQSRYVEFADASKEDRSDRTTKDLSPVDPKATYFAVTYIDRNKEKNEFEYQSASTCVTTTDGHVKQDLNVQKPYGSLHSENIPQETYVKDLESICALNQYKTNRSQVLMEDLIVKSDKSSGNGRQNVIDLDSVLKRSKRKTSTEDVSPSYKEPNVQPSLKDQEKATETAHEEDLNVSGLEPKGNYKSKVVDIDSLMADYRTIQEKAKDDKLGDVLEDQKESSWERSRSFRSYMEKGPSSKWKDPSVKSFHSDEGHHYQSVSSWYASREIASGQEIKAEDLKPSQPKGTDAPDNTDSFAEANYQKKPVRTGEDPGLHTNTAKNQNLICLDSLLESTNVHADNKSHSSLHRNTPEARTEGPTPRTLVEKTSFVERRVDDDQKNNMALSFDHKGSNQTESKSSSVDLKSPHSEGRRPAKASDILSLMLVDKEKRREQYRARQTNTAENRRTPGVLGQQEWAPTDYKEPTGREVSRRRSARLQEVEAVTEPSQRRSRNQHKERAAELQQDHLKQCFSRTSPTTKDTDILVQEPDRHYGTWSPARESEDSFVREPLSYDNVIASRRRLPASRLSSVSQTEADQHDSITDPSLDRSSMDMDSTDGTDGTPSHHEAKATDFSFIDQTAILDSTALKNRVHLSRKSQRRAPTSLSQHKSRMRLSDSTVMEDSRWMYTDTTAEKTEREEDTDDEEEEEEKPQKSSVQPQRMPMFGGLDPSALKAQLRKRPEQEGSGESSTQPSRSPKSPLPPGTMGIKLLPTAADKQDRAGEVSPQWLKELKSKKRQSQYENQT